jgi:hypothetical protein
MRSDERREDEERENAPVEFPAAERTILHVDLLLSDHATGQGRDFFSLRAARA